LIRSCVFFSSERDQNDGRKNKGTPVLEISPYSPALPESLSDARQVEARSAQLGTTR